MEIERQDAVDESINLDCVLAVIPARSGSKGIPDKNIRSVAGKPLLAWSILYAKYHGLRTIVSTDSHGYADIAREYGVEVPFLRPERLSGDSTRSADVVLHALEEVSRLEGVTFKYVVMLEPTSPIRSATLFERVLDRILFDGADSVVSVQANQNFHPNFALASSLGHCADARPLHQESDLARRRQDLAPVYFPDGSMYAARVDAFRRNRSFYGSSLGIVLANRMEALDIDTEDDIELAELLLSQIQAMGESQLERPRDLLKAYAWMLS